MHANEVKVNAQPLSSQLGTQDSRGQILALAFVYKAFKLFKF